MSRAPVFRKQSTTDLSSLQNQGAHDCKVVSSSPMQWGYSFSTTTSSMQWGYSFSTTMWCEKSIQQQPFLIYQLFVQVGTDLERWSVSRSLLVLAPSACLMHRQSNCSNKICIIFYPVKRLVVVSIGMCR